MADFLPPVSLKRSSNKCQSKTLLTFPNCKINLGLNILSKRDDGYHNIETCFYPVQWCDVLEVVISDNLNFTSTGINIPGNQKDNLCLKAYHLVKKDYDIAPIDIHLHKIIPIGAGLGGGSSDAAKMLVLLNDFFELNLPEQKLEVYAKKLGSDCVFFLKNKPVLALEKGTIFEPIAVGLSGLTILIVFPNIHISSKEAYSMVKPSLPKQSVKSVIEKYPVQEWKDHLKNDFEASVLPQYPVIGEIKEKLYEQGAVYASMSGSGSAVYGIFNDLEKTPHFFEKYLCWKGNFK